MGGVLDHAHQVAVGHDAVDAVGAQDQPVAPAQGRDRVVRLGQAPAPGAQGARDDVGGDSQGVGVGGIGGVSIPFAPVSGLLEERVIAGEPADLSVGDEAGA